MENQDIQLDASEPERAVDAFNAIFGQQARNRVTVRFSCFSGNPNVADNDPMASPRGVAVKFHLGGGNSDIVAHSFNGFPAATTHQFRELLMALAASGASVPHPTPIERFFSEHPRARAFFEAPKPPPKSYATLSYFGVKSFRFTNARGEMAVGRYRIEPVAGEHFVDGGNLHPDYLRRELPKRLPVSFKLLVQLAAHGDPVDDPSLTWPDSRPTVELGTLEIRTVSSLSEDALVFAPGALPQGIAPADRMIPDRDVAYDVSFRRRHR
jgi:catalase